MADNTGRGVLIAGLGRFGTAMATKLMALGYDVLAVDEDMATVQRVAPLVTSAAQIDSNSISRSDFCLVAANFSPKFPGKSSIEIGNRSQMIDAYSMTFANSRMFPGH